MPRFSPELLRALREDRGLTREQVADRIGKTVSSITKYEQGAMTPSVPALGDLADLYGIDVAEMFDADDPTDPVTALAIEIRAMVAALPPLPPARRARLRALLRGAASAS